MSDANRDYVEDVLRDAARDVSSGDVEIEFDVGVDVSELREKVRELETENDELKLRCQELMVRLASCVETLCLVARKEGWDVTNCFVCGNELPRH